MKYIATQINYWSESGQHQEGLRCWETTDVKVAALNHAHILKPYLTPIASGKFANLYMVKIDCWNAEDTFFSTSANFESAGELVLCAELGNSFRLLEHRISDEFGTLPDHFYYDSPRKEGRADFSPILPFPHEDLDFDRALLGQSAVLTEGMVIDPQSPDFDDIYPQALEEYKRNSPQAVAHSLGDNRCKRLRN